MALPAAATGRTGPAGRDSAGTGPAGADAGTGAGGTGEGGSGGSGGTLSAAERAAARAVRNLLARQHADGWWKGDLQTNVTMDAEDLLLRQFLGIRDRATTRAAARFIRSEQSADGSWATFHGGPGDLSTTI
ncbi:squalene--hopene cyclase, partial [Streptomyces sp. NPDC048845]